jgi:predicted outer membrane repeat protein
MIMRTPSRWLLSVALAAVTLVTINLLVVTPRLQGRPAATLINCSGSIQACIDAANDGDTILIAAGRYTESLTLSKPVSLTGENRDTTIIHAVTGQRVLTVTGATISNSVVISGLTITGGSADYGGGVLITDTAEPLIRDSILISNAASVNGGGLYAQGDLTLMNSRIISNTAASDGGGLYAIQPLTIAGSEISNNRTTDAWQRGGGLFSRMQTWVADSRFTRNSSTYGGGLYTVSPALILIDTDFISNVGGGVFAGNEYSRTEVRISSGHFTGNSNYSALSVYGSLDVTNTQFLSNTGETFYGAGVSVYAGLATIVSARFENNHCEPHCLAGGLSFYRYSAGLPSLSIIVDP